MSKRCWQLLSLVVGLFLAGALWAYAGHPLSGRAVDAETGQALAGAAVRGAGHQAVADAEGRFRLRGLRGRPILSAEAPGYATVAQRLALGELAGLGGGVELRLAPVELRGRVIDAASGEPVPGATVRVGEQQVEADAEGRYTVRRVVRGDAITARAPLYQESDRRRFDGEPTCDVALSLLPVTVAARDLCTGRSLAGATLMVDGQALQMGAQGEASFTPQQVRTELQVTRDGYEAASGAAEPGERVAVDLRPRPVCGTVRGADGEPLAGALVLARLPGQEPRLTYTDERGEYRLEDVPPEATLVIRQATYARAELRPGSEPCTDVRLEPFAAKGIYLAFHMITPGYEAELRRNLELVERSELNAIVIEIKTETGYLGFDPQHELAREIGAGDTPAIDVGPLLADCRRRGIYTIARIPVFEDDLLATARPEWAVHRSDGGVWRAAGGRGWVDPFRREVWEYNIALAREAAALGFDEIQLDYVRFPSDGAVLDCRYIEPSTAASRVEAITAFLAYARQEMDKTGAFLSADLFGLTTFDAEEKGIGQLLERVGPHVDYVSPMVYPSTYLPGMLDLDDPWRSPYEVVKLSLLAARAKADTPIRPWLQHFDDYHGLGITYGLEELQRQKQGARDGGSWGWLFWNILGEYDPAAFAGE